MRTLPFLAVLPLLLSAHLLAAQSAPVASSSLPNAPTAHWSNVASLHSGTRVWIDTGFHSTSCRLGQVTAEKLICDADGPRDFNRSDITAVRTKNRGGSAVVLGAVGAGVGILVVKIVALSLGDGFLNGHAKGSAYAGGAAAGAIIFAPIGYASGFLHRTIYRPS